MTTTLWPWSALEASEPGKKTGRRGVIAPLYASLGFRPEPDPLMELLL
ncbi:hypothetical protein ACWGH3_29435 [Streptomyces sp. NPDC054884]|nr:hypothetical protein [Streptomyces sp. ME08-AFT2]MDX3312361.1 hypothetical protein [Streptomyces sp. ME08-AFT2]